MQLMTNLTFAKILNAQRAQNDRTLKFRCVQSKIWGSQHPVLFARLELDPVAHAQVNPGALESVEIKVAKGAIFSK